MLWHSLTRSTSSKVAQSNKVGVRRRFLWRASCRSRCACERLVKITASAADSQRMRFTGLETSLLFSFILTGVQISPKATFVTRVGFPQLCVADARSGLCIRCSAKRNLPESALWSSCQPTGGPMSSKSQFKRAVHSRVSPLDVAVLLGLCNQNKPAPCMSSSATISKGGCSRCNGATGILHFSLLL